MQVLLLIRGLLEHIACNEDLDLELLLKAKILLESRILLLLLLILLTWLVVKVRMFIIQQLLQLELGK